MIYLIFNKILFEILKKLIKDINKKSIDVLKIFLVNKVEGEKLSKKIEKFFRDENSEDVFCILKAFRNKVAHGGINASISLNDSNGDKLGNVTFKQSSLIYKSMSELQIEIIDTWFLTKIKL